MKKSKTLNLRDIIVISVISIVFGLLYLFWIFISGTLRTFIGPFAPAILSGLWVMACIVCAYIIRKPGVAFIGEIIAAITEILVGSVSAGSVMILGVTQGLGCELILALFLYKKWGLKALILSGMGGTMANFLTSYFLFDWDLLAPGLLIGLIVIMLISGGLASWWSVLLSDSLAKTGVLDAFPIIQENQERVING